MKIFSSLLHSPLYNNQEGAKQTFKTIDPQILLALHHLEI